MNMQQYMVKVSVHETKPSPLSRDRWSVAICGGRLKRPYCEFRNFYYYKAYTNANEKRVP